MTKLEILRWKLNKESTGNIFCCNRKKNYITINDILLDHDIVYIEKIAKRENIEIEIIQNKIYLKGEQS